MINPNLIKLTEKLKNDSNYLKEMQGIKNSQELYNYCSKIVSGYSKAEFDAFIKSIVNMNSTVDLLSEDSLSLINGGIDKEQRKSWQSKFSSTAMRFSKISMFVKLGEKIYFDDIENMSPEEMITFVNDFAESVGYN